MSEELVFGRAEARQYEAWFETPDGRRVDEQEKALMARLLADLGDPGTILEVACGTGHFSRWFKHELGWRVHGIDISRPMLEEALSRDADFEVALADGTALPFPDRSYDVVVIITALEFMSEPVRALREAVRVARRGMMVCALNRWSLLAAWRRLTGLFVATPYDKAHFLSARELRQMFQEAAPGLSAQVETRTGVWPGLLSAFEGSTGILGAFLGMRVCFGRDHLARSGLNRIVEDCR